MIYYIFNDTKYTINEFSNYLCGIYPDLLGANHFYRVKNLIKGMCDSYSKEFMIEFIHNSLDSAFEDVCLGCKREQNDLTSLEGCKLKKNASETFVALTIVLEYLIKLK